MKKVVGISLNLFMNNTTYPPDTSEPRPIVDPWWQLTHVGYTGINRDTSNLQLNTIYDHQISSIPLKPYNQEGKASHQFQVVLEASGPRGIIGTPHNQVIGARRTRIVVLYWVCGGSGRLHCTCMRENTRWEAQSVWLLNGALTSPKRACDKYPNVL